MGGGRVAHKGRTKFDKTTNAGCNAAQRTLYGPNYIQFLGRLDAIAAIQAVGRRYG